MKVTRYSAPGYKTDTNHI